MGLTLAAPLALLGLVALPLIYWLLRLTPPAPREIVFAPIAILRKLAPRERSSAVTPWPLLLLRLAVAAAATLAMAGPVWNFSAASTTNAPLLLVLDNGWDAAPTWERRMEAARWLFDEAGRGGASVALLAVSEAAIAPQPTLAARAAEQLAALRPRPFLPARGVAAKRLSDFAETPGGTHIVWIASGLAGEEDAIFVEALRGAGRLGAKVEILADARRPRALVDVTNGASALEVSALSDGAPASGVIEALDDKGRTVAKQSFSILPGQSAKARFELPAELRNQVSQLRIAGEASAGAVALLDASQRVRRVAIVTGGATNRAQPLLSPTHYLERALQPFAQISLPSGTDELPALAALEDRPDMLILADADVAPGEAFERLSDFVEKGGVLLRFAGPRLANDPDGLTPTRLRRNGRVLGGAMSWEEPKRLAPFDEASPFFGLSVPNDVSVSRQILAEPDPGLADRTWARLADGTPLVTFERRGEGLIVMFHVSADPSWSNLPMSGLFVEMLRRISAESRESAGGAVGGNRSAALAPWRSLDGFGAIVSPAPTAKPILADFSGPADADHPPGFYGAPGGLHALQTLAPGATLRALDLAALGLPTRPLDAARDALDLRGPLLAAVVVMLLLDWLALLWLSGRLRWAPVALALICGLAFTLAPDASRAESPARPPA
ncbi:MAG TPA: BatA domain-containing protein, partial [Methylocystis sp.]|nr:BatA domain-containing protein [Methylocystis sp.]